MPSPARLFKRFHTASTNGHLDLSLPWQVSKDPLKRPYKVRVQRSMVSQGVSLPVGKAQLAGCLKVWVSSPLQWDASIQ